MLKRDTRIEDIAWIFPAGTPVKATRGRSNTDLWNWEIQTEGLELSSLAKHDLVFRFPVVSDSDVVEETDEIVEGP